MLNHEKTQTLILQLTADKKRHERYKHTEAAQAIECLILFLTLFNLLLGE